MAEDEARSKAAHADYPLMRLDQRLVELQSGIGIVEFIMRDGKPPVGVDAIPERKALTLSAFP